MIFERPNSVPQANYIGGRADDKKDEVVERICNCSRIVSENVRFVPEGSQVGSPWRLTDYITVTEILLLDIPLDLVDLSLCPILFKMDSKVNRRS